MYKYPAQGYFYTCNVISSDGESIGSWLVVGGGGLFVTGVVLS